MDSSWHFLNNLDDKEQYLLNSAIELSGLTRFDVAGRIAAFVSFIEGITGTKGYKSFIDWNFKEPSTTDISLIESNYLNSTIKAIDKTSFTQEQDIIQTCFLILYLRGFSWISEILNEIYLSSSKPEDNFFLYGRDIFYGLPCGHSDELVAIESSIPRELLYFLKFKLIRIFASDYLRNKLIPIVCAMIIIRRERSYKFSNLESCLNYLTAYIASDASKETMDVAYKMLSPKTRSTVISQSKWSKFQDFENEVSSVLSQMSKDKGIVDSIDWNYDDKVAIIATDILAKRRHAFMHAISDDIKSAKDKLKRDCSKNLELQSLKGSEIVLLDEYFVNWYKDVKDIPLGNELSDTEIKSNIITIVNKGRELVETFSPFFHSLVNQYAFLFPGYQDGNNEAYRRLVNFIEQEDKLKKQIEDFSSIKTFGQISSVPVKFLIELVHVNLYDVTRHIDLKELSSNDNEQVLINTDDFQEYVLKNFISNLKEKAFFKNERTHNKLIISVSYSNDKMAIGISNNGEPFTGDIKKVFDECYSYGENKGNGQGMYDARQYMNYIGGDIQLKTYPYMEFPVRFVIIFPLKKII